MDPELLPSIAALPFVQRCFDTPLIDWCFEIIDGDIATDELESAGFVDLPLALSRGTVDRDGLDTELLALYEERTLWAEHIHAALLSQIIWVDIDGTRTEALISPMANLLPARESIEALDLSDEDGFATFVRVLGAVGFVHLAKVARGVSSANDAAAIWEAQEAPLWLLRKLSEVIEQDGKDVLELVVTKRTETGEGVDTGTGDSDREGEEGGGTGLIDIGVPGLGITKGSGNKWILIIVAALVVLSVAKR